MKTFTELRNAQSVTLAYDGPQSHATDVLLPSSPTTTTRTSSYFEQLEEGAL